MPLGVLAADSTLIKYVSSSNLGCELMVTDPVRDNPDSVTQDAEPAQVPDSETTPTPIDQPAQDASVPVTGESAEAGSATTIRISKFPADLCPPV